MISFLKDMTIKKRVVVTFTSLFFLSTALVTIVSYERQKKQLTESLAGMADSEIRLFQSVIEGDAQGLARAHFGLIRVEKLMKLFKERKKDELLEMARPMLDELKQKNNITHMYFIEPDGTVLLRVHRPEQFGDKVTRATFTKTSSTGQITSGIEMGKNFFSLRSVHPVSYEGELIGYLEVAQEIDHVYPLMKKTTGNSVSIFLTKDYVATKKSEVGGAKVGNFVILQSSDKETALSLAEVSSELMEKGLEKPVIGFAKAGKEEYVVAISPVHDAAGDLVGVLFSHRDVSSLFASMWWGILLNTAIFAVIFAATVVLLFLSMRKSLSLFDQVLKQMVSVTTHWDLTTRVEVKTKDEIGNLGDAFNRMVDNLKIMVVKIRETSGRVASAANDISTNSGKLEKSAQGQAVAAMETGGTMAEMAASIQNVAANADSLAGNVSEVSASMQQLRVSSEQVAKNSDNMVNVVASTSATIEEMTLSIDRVAKTTEELASTVYETSSTIEEMATSIEQVAGNAKELQQVIDETSVVVGEMSSSISKVAANVAEADKVAKTAAKEGSAGQQAVTDALLAMKRVADVIEKTAGSIENLGKRSEEIGSIVKVIDDIADQTNLLALNAAIEAARAGDAGRGFAVVAEEVRKLAERSMTATSEIAQVIKQVQADTSNSVSFGEHASREAKNSMELAEIAGGALTNIVESIGRTSELMSDIAAMASQQTTASGQVNRAVEKLSISSEVVANAAREQALGGRQIRTAVERMNCLTQEVAAATKAQSNGSQQIQESVANMNQTTRQVTLANQEQAVSARQIVTAVENMNVMTQSVANSTAEQKKGGEIIVSAVDNISSLANDNILSVAELSRSAEKLSRQAEELEALVAEFKVD